MNGHEGPADHAKVPRVAAGEYLTTDLGVRVNDNQNSLTAGERGPTLLEDFILREKITHFDHERIPERVVHARGSGAHGFFQVYQPMAEYTSAKFLQDPALKTPVFVRFSTVNGARGSADTARDARGFATKFYTEDGNYDLVGNNIPVFFIQDSIKFPDLVHAFKPEPHHEMPGASTAHDTFWDFISLTPESMHMILWIMSDRAIPRSYRTMEGFGVNTFRLVNAQGKARLVKFHWKPAAGVHSLIWDEAQKIAGKDPDFHRRDLWEAIENGDYPEYELAVQLIEEADQLTFDFDPLDATKIWPVEQVPLMPVGKMTLDRNPGNFFAETEVAAFHAGHVVPGIDFSADPLLQGRLFSYLDTQITRLGGPNFAQLPINQPHAAVNNHNQDGFGRIRNRLGRVNYEPATLDGGSPAPREATPEEGGFVSYPEEFTGPKLRRRSPSFADHYTQTAMFWHSQSAFEQRHIVAALIFELGKVETLAVRERMVEHLARVASELAARVAPAIGVAIPTGIEAAKPPRLAPETSIIANAKPGAKGRKIAILAADGVDATGLEAMKTALQAAGARAEVVAPHLGTLSAPGGAVPVDKALVTTGSVLYDAVYVPGGAPGAATLASDGLAVQFVNEAYKHGKPIAASDEGVNVLRAGFLGGPGANPNPDAATQEAHGIVLDAGAADAAAIGNRFVQAVGKHRFFDRPLAEGVPA